MESNVSQFSRAGNTFCGNKFCCSETRKCFCLRSTYIEKLLTLIDSHHDKNHKISTAATLIHRATNLPNSETGRDQGIKHVYTAFESNGYPTNLITQITKNKCFPSPVPTPEELVELQEKICPHAARVASLVAEKST